jgi:hypothetical protein
MPTRRIFELGIVIVALAQPAFGTVRIWAHKTLGVTQPGSFTHGLAEILVVLV